MAKSKITAKRAPAKKIRSDSDIPEVDLIERIPETTVDLIKFERFINANIEAISADRKAWEARREEYYQDIDNFVNYFAVKDLPFENASNIHVPVTLEKVRAVHARLYQAMFGVKPPFYAEPQEGMDEARLTEIYNTMRWALSRYCNYYKGIKGEADGFLWNFASEGWGVMHLSWERKVRKALVVEESLPTKDNLEAKTRFKETMKWIEAFSGPVLRNIQNEDFLMPGKGGVQHSPLIALKTTWTAHDLNYLANNNYFSKTACATAIAFPDYGGGCVSDQSTIDVVKGVNQGYDINAESNKAKDQDNKIAEYNGYIGYCTYDIDGDGFDEELVFWYHPASKQVLRWTYLDRITKTGRRPVYKADFIIRPGRNYALGLLELLHPLSVEVDALHNQRVDFGTISNMPFFFYRALSSLPNATINIAPGKGTPVDEPTQDVYFPPIGNKTAWGFQEENLLFQIVNRISGISDINVGQTPSNSEAVRSQGQLLTLLNEGNAQLDIPLRRVQDMFSDIYGDIHQMLVERLPNNFKHVIVGDDDTTIQRDPVSGKIMETTLSEPRRDIAGRVHFYIQANSTAGSRAQMFSSRLQLFQQYMNPVNLQLGIVGPAQIYNMNKALGEVSNEVSVTQYLNKPTNVMPPLKLIEEIDYLKQGIKPTVVLNDDHQSKAQALTVWINDASTIEGIAKGNINPNALLLTHQTVQEHAQYAQAMAQQTQAYQNSTGSPNPVPQPNQLSNPSVGGPAISGVPGAEEVSSGGE